MSDLDNNWQEQSKLPSSDSESGHNRMRHRICDTDQCSWFTWPMTTSHVLQACALREPLRKGIWPNGVNLQDQLYGGRVDHVEDSGVHPTSGIDCLEKSDVDQIRKREYYSGNQPHKAFSPSRPTIMTVGVFTQLACGKQSWGHQWFLALAASHTNPGVITPNLVEYNHRVRIRV
jgi:hypothetical protein